MSFVTIVRDQVSPRRLGGVVEGVGEARHHLFGRRSAEGQSLAISGLSWISRVSNLHALRPVDMEYELPGGLLGGLANKLFVEGAIERDVRHSMENFRALLEAERPVHA